MKKRFFAIYALVGALVASPIFTSCVDDNESASVTALRGAKAEQLKSVAAMNNAEAQAKLIYANAEAALKAAEAAVQQAKAQKIAALAKIKELEAQLKQDAYDAELAAALAQAEADKAEAEKNIAVTLGEAQKYQLDLEAQIAKLQKDLLVAKNELTAKENEIADAQYERLQTLAKNYSTLLYSYTEEQNSLANLKTQKLALEAGLVDLNEAKEKQIASNNATIAVIDQQIAYLKEYENYREDVETLQNERTLKQAEADKALDAENATQKKYYAARTEVVDSKELKEMLDKVYECEYLKMYNANWDDSEYKYTWTVNETDADGNVVNTYDRAIRFKNYNPIKLAYEKSFVIEKEGYNNFYSSADSIKVEWEAKDLRQLKLDVEDALAALDIKTLTDNEAAAKKALDDAKKAAADAKAAYEKDSSKRGAYEEAMGEESQAETAYNTAKTNLEGAAENKAKIEKLYALVSGSTEECVAEIEAYNKAALAAWEPVAELYFAWQDAEKVLADLNAELDAMDAVLTGNAETEVTLRDYILQQMNRWYNWSSIRYDGYKVDFTIDRYDWEGNYMYTDNYTTNIYIDLWNTMLTINRNELDGAVAIKTLIDGFETQKETLLAANEDLSAITTQEQSIALMEAEIAGKEAVVAALEVELSAAKVALDAAMPAEEEEGETELPEEGTEGEEEA